MHLLRIGEDDRAFIQLIATEGDAGSARGGGRIDRGRELVAIGEPTMERVKGTRSVDRHR